MVILFIIKKVIIFFYCGYEYLGCMVYLVNEFNLLDFNFFVWDVRGYGYLFGEWGDVLSFFVCVKDI